jgi:hypothetical protein
MRNNVCGYPIQNLDVVRDVFVSVVGVFLGAEQRVFITV